MSTVDYKQAHNIAAGGYPEDGFTRIVAYRNRWAGPSYKLLRDGDVLFASEWVFDLQTVWQKGESLQAFEIASALWEKSHIAPEHRSQR